MGTLFLVFFVSTGYISETCMSRCDNLIIVITVIITLVCKGKLFGWYFSEVVTGRLSSRVGPSQGLLDPAREL